MRAVNLIPSDARRAGRAGSSRSRGGPAVLIIAGLAVAVLLMTVYVLTNNTISERQASVGSLQAQAAQEQAEAARFVNYTNFASLARARAQTVLTIATARFDWHAALYNLSKVVPANTSLQSLFGSVAPGASVNGGGSGGANGTASLRGDISSPAFELTGCTKNQDDVARLMSRLRLIDGVTRVTLGDSVKSGTAQSGTSVSSSSGSSGSGCGANTLTFDIVVFFLPLPGAGATGVTSATPTSGSPATPGTAAGAVSTTSAAGAKK